DRPIAPAYQLAREANDRHTPSAQILLDFAAQVETPAQGRGRATGPRFPLRRWARGGAAPRGGAGGGGGPRRGGLCLHLDEHIAVAGAEPGAVGVHGPTLGTAAFAH